MNLISVDDDTTTGTAKPVSTPLTTADIAAIIGQLAMASPAGDDPDRIDRIGALEALKAAAAAAQAHDLVSFADSQVADQAAKGVRAATGAPASPPRSASPVASLRTRVAGCSPPPAPSSTTYRTL